MKENSLIILMTDFGLVDPYVGIMKGIIAQLAPHIRCIDLTHEIPPGDIQRAAIFLWQSRTYFPKNSIFLCVVDPGVGTSRRAIIVNADEQWYVGPDNGIFSFIVSENSRSWAIQPERINSTPSFTFHGRDIFAPTAAFLANGRDPDEFGYRIVPINFLSNPKLEFSPHEYILGEVLYEDRFGNLITSLGIFLWVKPNILQFNSWLPTEPKTHMVIDVHHARVSLPNKAELPMVHTYGELDFGACGCLIGSSGLLEIVANQSRASQRLGLKRGDMIILRIHDKEKPNG